MAKPDVVPGVTTLLNLANVLNTINPFSGLYGTKNKLYIPLWLIKAFMSDPDKSADKKDAARAAHITAKAVSGIGVGAALAALLRYTMQHAKLDRFNKASYTPGKDIYKSYKRPYTMTLGKTPLIILELLRKRVLLEERKAEELRLQQKMRKEESLSKLAVDISPIPSPSLGTTYTNAKVAVPAVSAFIAFLATMAMADKYYDRKLYNKLIALLQALDQANNQVMLLRIMRNRGVANKAEDNLLKTANSLYGSDRLLASLGLLAVILFGASAIGGYAWANDKNKTLKLYLARKKGLLAYSKARAILDNTYQLGIDPAVAAKLDSNLKGKAPAVTGNHAYTTIDI